MTLDPSPNSPTCSPIGYKALPSIVATEHDKKCGTNMLVSVAQNVINVIMFLTKSYKGVTNVTNVLNGV